MTGDERRRMRGVIFSLAIGATGGAYLLLHAPLYAPVLSLVVTAFVVLTAARVFRDKSEAQEEVRRAA